MSRFRTLQQISLPGSSIHANEDGSGVHGPSAWIIDGATGVSGTRLTPDESDTAWLSRLIDEILRRDTAWTAPVGATLKALESETGDCFARVAPGCSVEDHAAPSACLGLIRIRDATERAVLVQGGFLGDVVALVPTRDGILRWTDERAKPFERLTLASLQEGGVEPGEIPLQTRRQILDNRTKLNQPEGYWVVHPLRPWAGHELTFEAQIELGRPIALASDGFMRLVDVFGTYTDEALYDALARGEAPGLMRELRELEAEEGSLDSCPRVKMHDDATVLVIAAVNA